MEIISDSLWIAIGFGFGWMLKHLWDKKCVKTKNSKNTEGEQ